MLIRPLSETNVKDKNKCYYRRHTRSSKNLVYIKLPKKSFSQTLIETALWWPKIRLFHEYLSRTRSVVSELESWFSESCKDTWRAMSPCLKYPRTMVGWLPTWSPPGLWGMGPSTPASVGCLDHRPEFISKRLFFKLYLEKLERKVNVRGENVTCIIS